jgi:hypothetical protein
MPRDEHTMDEGDTRHAGWSDLEARAHLHVLELMVQRLYLQLANRTGDPARFIEQALAVALRDVETFRTPADLGEAEAQDLRRAMTRHADALFHGIKPGR